LLEIPFDPREAQVPVLAMLQLIFTHCQRMHMHTLFGNLPIADGDYLTMPDLRILQGLNS